MPNIKHTRLWLARKRLGYEQKQIANLLGYETITQISRYETGQRPPSLKTAIKLSIIYKLPVRILFDSYHKECVQELIKHAQALNKRPSFSIDLTEPSDYCSYMEIMKTQFMTDVDRKKVQRHITALLSDRKQKILGH